MNKRKRKKIEKRFGLYHFKDAKKYAKMVKISKKVRESGYTSPIVIMEVPIQNKRIYVGKSPWSNDLRTFLSPITIKDEIRSGIYHF